MRSAGGGGGKGRAGSRELSVGKTEQGAGGGGEAGEGDEADGRGRGRAAGAGDPVRFDGAAGGVGEDLTETLAAVGQRAEVEGPLGVACAQGGGGVGAGGGRGERVFEFVEGEEDVHGRGAEGWPRRGRGGAPALL